MPFSQIIPPSPSPTESFFPLYRNIFTEIQIKVIPGLCGKWIQDSFLKKKKKRFILFYSYTLFKLFVHLLHAVCKVQWWIYLEITPFPQSHSPPFCYPYGPHTGHVSWGKFLCSLFKGKVPPLKLIFYFLLSENGKYATVCFLFWLKCQKTWSQILVTTSSWELGSIFLSLSLLPLVGFYSVFIPNWPILHF